MFKQRDSSNIHSTEMELDSTGEYNKHCNHPLEGGRKLHLSGREPVWN